MILLKATTESLQFVTTSVAAIDYSISFADITTTTFNPSSNEGKITTATTSTTLSAPAASTQRQVKLVTITNRDASASNTVMVQKLISGVAYVLAPTFTLLAGESAQYLDGQGWVVFSSNGSIKGDMTAAGSSGQIQVNTNGFLTGDPDITWNGVTNEFAVAGPNPSVLLGGITTEPAVPAANTLRIYSKNVSGRMLPKWVGPSGVDTPFQPALFGNNVTIWNPTNATAGMWTGTVGAGAGTFSAILPGASNTNIYASVKRSRWANVVTTTNQVLGQRNTEAMYIRGNLASTGGFFFFARFGLDTWTTGGRLFVGMHTSTAVVTAEPSASTNILGFAVNSTDTSITFMHNDASGTATKETITHPALASNNAYDAVIYCRPSDTTVYYRLTDLNSGVVLIDSSTNTDLPVSTTGLTAGVLASNAAIATVTAINIGVNRIYVESDY